MAVTLTFVKKRAALSEVGQFNLRIVDITFDIGAGTDTLVTLTAAQQKSIDLVRPPVFVFIQQHIGRVNAGANGLAIVPEVDDTTGLVTFRFWETGGANAPFIPNDSAYTGANAPTVRVAFLSK